MWTRRQRQMCIRDRGNWVAQEYLPKSLRGLKIWEPNNNGWEKKQYEDLLRRKEN